MMRQDAKSNRERDDRIDVALGLYQGVMAYDLEVYLEGERTGLQVDHMVRMIAGLELARAAKSLRRLARLWAMLLLMRQALWSRTLVSIGRVGFACARSLLMISPTHHGMGKRILRVLRQMMSMTGNS